MEDFNNTAGPLRVLLASESPLGDMNGVTTSVRETLRYLQDHNHEALIVCPKPAPKEFASFEVVHTRSIPFQGFNLGLPSPRKIPKIIENYNPDVVHVASPAWTIGKTALLGGLLMDIPTVAIYQTDIANYARRFKVNSLTAYAERTIAALHNYATRNLVPSVSARNDLIRFGVHEQTIYQWSRGVDSKRFDPERKNTPKVRALKEQLSHGGTRPVVGYIGRLAVEKRVERLSALNGLDMSLVIVGDGPQRPKLESVLPKDTIFLGELRGNKLADAYAALDIFVHTGTQETFGQTLQEAMAAGLPVVAPAVGGPLDIVKQDINGLLYVPEDDSSLRMNVQRMLQDKTERIAMGSAGRAIVALRTWDVLGQELEGHYRAAIG